MPSSPVKSETSSQQAEMPKSYGERLRNLVDRIERQRLKLLRAQHLETAARKLKQAMSNLARPSVIIRPSLMQSLDGQTFIAAYGSLHVQGDTPEEAFAAFDRAWLGLE